MRVCVHATTCCACCAAAEDCDRCWPKSVETSRSSGRKGESRSGQPVGLRGPLFHVIFHFYHQPSGIPRWSLTIVGEGPENRAQIGPPRLHKTSMASCEVPDVCFVWVGSRGPITMLVYRLWYRRELAFTIHDAVAATIPIHAPFIPFNIE